MEKKKAFNVSEKRWIIRELESGRLSMSEACELMSDASKDPRSMIHYWQKKYSPGIAVTLPVMTEKERQKLEAAQKRMKALEKQLEDALADKLRVDIRAVMVRAKQVFKEGSAAYNRFGTKGLDTLSDSDLVRCARRVVRMGTLYMAQLAPKGLTPAILAALGAGATSLDDAIDDQDTALRARTVGTQERVELANALYDNIVELFDFGKDHWYTRNETKYNDYVIYDLPCGSGSAPIELTGEIPPMSTVNIKDGIAPKAKVSVKNVGTVPFTVCSTDSAAESCTIGQVILPGEEVSFTGGSSGVPLLKPFLNATNNDPGIIANYTATIG